MFCSNGSVPCPPVQQQRTRCIGHWYGSPRNTLRPTLPKQFAPDSQLITDEAKVYKKFGRKFFDGHSIVNHRAGEYARAAGITTNTVESSFALFKRRLYGRFHHVGAQHLQRYATEFDFRWNNRKATDKEPAATLLRGIEGKRLTHQQTAE